ncbi:RidA family protein [Sphaerimonospora mesophila]|uniref:RidA family protein n=1 Tax=Sphaerimonospora mesophila TaxID=37483 RepID=UPI0006E31146
MSDLTTFSQADGVSSPIAPYSLMVRSNNARSIYHIAGQCAVDASGAVMGATIEEQTAAVFDNLTKVLAVDGLKWSNVVKLTCYVVNRGDIRGFNAAREKAFTELLPNGPYPANSLIIVSGLVWPELLLEIEGVAVA